MKTMLRNAARKWANQMLVRSNDSLRRELIKAEAAAERHEQTAIGATKACNDAGRSLLQANAYNQELRAELKRKEDQIERQANLFEQMREQADTARRERDAANVANGNLSTYNAELARLLNEAINRLQAARGFDEHWADAAGVAGPETRGS